MSEVKKLFDLSDLVHATREKTEFGVEVVDETLKAAFKILASEISKRGYATIHHFGTFGIKTLAAEKGIDPHGDPYEAPERVTIEFNPAKAFRAELTIETGKPAIL